MVVECTEMNPCARIRRSLGTCALAALQCRVPIGYHAYGQGANGMATKKSGPKAISLRVLYLFLLNLIAFSIYYFSKKSVFSINSA